MAGLLLADVAPEERREAISTLALARADSERGKQSLDLLARREGS